MLPTDAKERKKIPVYSGFVRYFPDAIVEVAKVSKRGNEQHNPGSTLHWDRSKSQDEQDSCVRHIIDGAIALDIDDKIEHAAGQAWRSLANLQKLCENRDRDEGSFLENSKSQKIAPPVLDREEIDEYICRLNVGHNV